MSEVAADYIIVWHTRYHHREEIPVTGLECRRHADIKVHGSLLRTRFNDKLRRESISAFGENLARLFRSGQAVVELLNHLSVYRQAHGDILGYLVGIVYGVVHHQFEGHYRTLSHIVLHLAVRGIGKIHHYSELRPVDQGLVVERQITIK